MDPIAHVIRIFSNPPEFFSDVAEEKSVTASVVSYITVQIVTAVLNVLMAVSLAVLMFGSDYWSAFGSSILFPVLLIFEVVVFFIFIGLTFAFAKIFKAQISAVQVANICLYSSIPGIVARIIPVMGGIIGAIYSIVLMIIGISKIGKISGFNAFFIVFIPTLICLSIPVLLFFALFSGIIDL